MGMVATLQHPASYHLRYHGSDRTFGIARNFSIAVRQPYYAAKCKSCNNATFWMTNANRLQNANGPWGAKTFYYDSVGNRTTEISTPTGGATTTDVLGYPGTSNRVVQITRGAQTVRQMTYDNAGNLLTDGGNAYAYNNRNRMASATIGAIVWNYTTNGKEQLAIRARVSPAATTHFIHDLWGNVLAETNGTATGTTREYIWLPEVEIAPADGARSQVDRPIAVVNAVNTATPATWYVSVDHLNRPIKMTDAAKASVWDAVWQPWGGVHSITGTASLDARLPGQWFQAETGLHYNWHRQYDPTVGRYTQPDPLGFVDGPSVYGGGLPQQVVDPDGQNPLIIPLTVCARYPQLCAGIIVKTIEYCMAKTYSCTTKCQSNGAPGGAYYLYGTSNKSCSDATKTAKASAPRGEYPRHCSCSDTKGFRGTGHQCE
jgi:RHS repeat-associated protein